MSSTFHGLSEAEVDQLKLASVWQPSYNQQELDKVLLNVVAKRVVQEKLVHVRDQKFYVIQGVIIVTRAKISDELFNIDFQDKFFL